MSTPFPNLPQPPARPRMFADTRARIIWMIVPVISVGLLAFLPFVIARPKGVVTTRVAAAYCTATGVIVVLGALVSEEATWPEAIVFVVMVTAAVHTWLLDSDAVKIGKTW